MVKDRRSRRCHRWGCTERSCNDLLCSLRYSLGSMVLHLNITVYRRGLAYRAGTTRS